MKFSPIKIIIVALAASVLLSINCIMGSLDLFFEPPDSPIANAGPDQQCKVGEIIFLDGTESLQGKGGKINWWAWDITKDSPTIQYLPQGDDNSTAVLGFDEEGVYKIYLILKDESGAISKPDTLLVTVTPRTNVLFEDPKLEICVRLELQKPTGDLSENEVQSLDSLNLLTPIKEDVESLKGINNCTNLEFLHAPLQKLKDLDGIEKLNKLKILVIDQQRILNDISQLSGLTNLIHLDLNDNAIEDVSALAGLTRLEFLDLRFNHIKDISSLENLINLELLWFVNGDFGDITSVRNMTKLKKLKFHKCKVTDISPLENLKNLVSLEADLNFISDISPLAELTNLKELLLGENEIEDISPLENLINLNHMRLWGNNIKDIGPLVRNNGIGKGDVIYLLNNPLNEKSVNEYIPALQERGVVVEY